MPVWANTGTFTVAPSASFQNDGFDPTLPFPVEFLNWKLNELDPGGYFEHATGLSSNGAVMRGGDTATGVITEVLVNDGRFAVTKYTGGTLESPTGATEILNYSNALSLWSFQGGQVTFDSLVSPFEGLNTDPNTTTNLRYGYASNPVFYVYCGQFDTDWGQYLDTSTSYLTPNVAFKHTPGSGVSYLEIKHNNTTPPALVCPIPLGAYNTEAGSTMRLTNFECQARTTNGAGHSGTLEVVAKPRDGSAEIVLASDTIPNNNPSTAFVTQGAAMSHNVDLSANIYFIRFIGAGFTNAPAESIDIKNLYVSVEKSAVE